MTAGGPRRTRPAEGARGRRAAGCPLRPRGIPWYHVRTDEKGGTDMNENEAEQVKGFRYMVKLLIEIGSPTVVGNESPAHAKVLLEEMFNAAKKTAYVYCGRISDAVWGGDGVSAAVKGAIDRGVDVRFIVQHPDKIPAGSRVKAILDENRIAVHSSRSFAQINSHFAVFDGRMYRFEKDDAAKTATACMNNPGNGEALRELALEMIEKASA